MTELLEKGQIKRSGPYSELKAAWHTDRMMELRFGARCRPIELQLILSDLCNHDCHFCAYRASNGLSSQNFGDETGNMNPNRMIPHEKALEILDDAKRLKVQSVIFTGGGEPSVHPQHMGIYRHALDLGLSCSLNTNGQLLRVGWEEVLPRFAYVRFSVDAANAEEYARIRRVKPAVYDKVLANLARVAEACSPDCTVGAGYVVTPENWPNLEQGLTNLRATGVEYVRLAAMQTTDGLASYPEDSYRQAREACRRAEELSGEGFRVVNLFDGAIGQKMTDPFCGFQHLVLYCGADLKLYRCCYTAYTDLGDLGSIRDRSLMDWWADGETEQLLRQFDARSCDSCPLHRKNELIAFMADPAPHHVEFV